MCGHTMLIFYFHDFFIGFPLSGNGFERLDANIQFKAYKQYQGIDVNDHHQHNNGAQGSIQGIILSPVIYKCRKPQRGKDA